jgi:hypothetical protein
VKLAGEEVSEDQAPQKGGALGYAELGLRPAADDLDQFGNYSPHCGFFDLPAARSK